MKILGYNDLDGLKIKAGDKVEIPAGTKFTSTNPSKKSGVTKKKQIITVDHILCGMEAPEGHYQSSDFSLTDDEFNNLPRKKVLRDGELQNNVVINNPSVCWIGSGNYWMNVDINDVILISN